MQEEGTSEIENNAGMACQTVNYTTIIHFSGSVIYCNIANQKIILMMSICPVQFSVNFADFNSGYTKTCMYLTLSRVGLANPIVRRSQ